MTPRIARIVEGINPLLYRYDIELLGYRTNVAGDHHGAVFFTSAVAYII